MSEAPQAKPVAYLILTQAILANLPHLPWTLMGDMPKPGDILMVGRPTGLFIWMDPGE